MDKTLEIIMVAVALVVAVVIVTALLQGQASSFGGFAQNQTDSSGCTITLAKFENSVDCNSGSVSPSASNIYTNNDGCFTASDAGDAKSNVCP